MPLRRILKKVSRKGIRASASAAASRVAEWGNEMAELGNDRVLGPALSPFRKGQVAMFHVGRSGSSVLARCLNQHSQIYWKGEVFKPPQNEGYDPLHVLRNERRKAGRRFFGFEVKPKHLYSTSHTLADHIEALHRAGVEHFVLLRRKNVLRKIVSSMVAERHTHHLSSDGEEKLVRVKIDVQNAKGPLQAPSLLEQLESFRSEYRTIEKNIEKHHSLQLTYEEDIYESPLIAYRKVLRFLNREHEDAEIKLKKINPFPLHEVISNFQEVETYLKDTEHEWMLYE